MIVNLTQHPATPAQMTAGVEDVPADLRKNLVAGLTFDRLPTVQEVCRAVDRLVEMVDLVNADHDIDAVMIGGAPFLMMPLTVALRRRGYRVVFAFSARDSVETINADGTVSKSSVFRHAGFVEAVE